MSAGDPYPCFPCVAGCGRLGDYDSDALCPACQEAGWEVQCDRHPPCLSTPQGEYQPCRYHEDLASERLAEADFAAYHGGTGAPGWYR